MTTPTDKLPDFADLTKKLGTPDAVFEAWRDATADKHWAHFDLSALRIGYELGKAHDAAQAQPASVADSTEMLALREIVEEWAGAECGKPVYAQEAYAIHLAERMYKIAAETLTVKQLPTVAAAPQPAKDK